MEWFSSEHVVPLEVAIERKTCQIGENIWIIQDVGGPGYEILKYDTKTRKCKKVEYNNRNPMDIRTEEQTFLFGRKFGVFTSNDKIYMTRFKLGDFPWETRLIEFNTSTLELRDFVDLQPERLRSFWIESQWLVNGDAMYYLAHSGEMKVVNKNTLEVTLVPFPGDEESLKGWRTYNICELDTSIYLVFTAYPAIKTVFCYDTNNSQFELFSSEVELPWEKSKHELNYMYVQSFVWTGDNEIYQAFNFKKQKILIDCFDVQTKKWSTIFHYEFEKNSLPISNAHGFVNICGSAKSAYVISDNMMELVIQKIGNPRLEAICLHNLAATEATKLQDSAFSTIKLPIPLREPFAELLAWKTGEKRLSQLEYHLNMIAKFEVAKENLITRANGNREFQIGLDTAWDFWKQLKNRQAFEKLQFEQLRKDLEQKLKQTRCKKMKVEEQVQKNMDAQTAKFEKLVQLYETDLKPRMEISETML